MNASTVLHGRMIFNDEDLLYLNRISFMLLCEHGTELKFDIFIEVLTTLQEGTFKQKMELLAKMFVEGRD